MKIRIALVTLFLSFGLAPLMSAQGIPEMSGPAPEHDFLQKFVGEWEVVSEGSPGEGQPSITAKAVMKSSMLGKLWLVNASNTEIAGMKMDSIQMIGFDPQQKKYVGIWADSMINHLWHYQGTVDESGRKLVLSAEGPTMTGDGKMARYQDAFEFKDDDTIVTTSSMQAEDGTWTVFMTGTAKRRRQDGTR